MYRVSVDLLKPGMVVAKAIHTSDGRVLVNAGISIKQRYIENLRDLGIAAIYVEDQLTKDVPVQDVVDEATRRGATKTIREFFLANQHSNAGRSVMAGRELRQTIDSLIDDLLNQKYLMVNLQDIRALDDYTFGHSVNVSILVLITGIGLGFSRTQLFHLGMGALMHDIGKLTIPPMIINKPGKLTGEEFTVMKKHSQEGFNILRRQNDISLLSAHLALEHHEKHDGSGYPKGLHGNEIHLFSRICAIADVFDAITADRVYRRAVQPHEAYELLAASGGGHFDFKVVNAFLRHIAAYPVGTWVELNTGEIGFVVETKPGFSTRPQVRLLFDLEKRPMPPVEINLANELERLIMRVVSQEEVKGINPLLQAASSMLK